MPRIPGDWCLAVFMKINISDITEQGIELREKIAVDGTDLETEFVKFLTPLDIQVQAVKISNAANIDISGESTVEMTCHRCLDRFEQDLRKRVNLTYPTDKDLTVDIFAQIREEIILGYPVKVLCKDDCRGICPRCGMNLNRNQCICAQ